MLRSQFRIQRGYLMNDHSSPIIVFNIAWMARYQGDLDTLSHGGFAWLKENDGSGEQHNFSAYKGQVYGYVPHKYESRINIDRLGAAAGDDRITGVTVVFKARDPERGGSVVVGVYRNATVFRERQVLPTAARRRQIGRELIPEYRASCSAEDAILLPPDKRPWLIQPGEVGPGLPKQTAIFYPVPGSKLAKRLEKILSDIVPGASGSESKAKSKKGKQQVNIERRQAVERAAINFVSDHYASLGFDVASVESENVGFDLIAKSKELTLNLEVKGRSGPEIIADLSFNEYKVLKAFQREAKPSAQYRVCIVVNALTNPVLHDFRYLKSGKAGNWFDPATGNVLEIKALEAARLSAVPR